MIKQQELDKLRNASIWDLPGVLESIELYDKKTAEEAIDEVYQEFETGENLVEEIVTPVFYSIIDGFLQGTSFGRAAKKKGLSASRVVSECESFSYEFPSTLATPISSDNSDYLENTPISRTPYQGNRKYFEDKNRMNAYKSNAVKNNGGRKNLEDEYTGQKNITAYRNNPDFRRKDEKHDFQAEPDHIIPLAQLHEQMSKNFALSDRDIKNIANIDENLALTSGYINGRKLDSSNSEFIANQENLKREGKPYVELSEEAKYKMLNLEQNAQDSVNNKINAIVLNNLLGKGIADRDSRKMAHLKEEERLGRKLTEEERNSIDDKLGKDKQLEIEKKLGSNAVSQAKDVAIGNVILYIVKPLYYEIKDIFINGLQEGVNAESATQALAIRFKRVKKYTINNIIEFIENNLKDFILNVISSLIEGIINLFVGVFKRILKVVKEGIKIAAESCKILFGENSKNMSSAEKGDAILKLFAGTVTSLFGVLIEAALNNIGIGEPWSVILSCMLSGIASAFVMYGLNKADLFSVKEEKRKARLKEIFDQRLKDIRDAKAQMTSVAIEAIRKQRIELDRVTREITEAIDENNIQQLNLNLQEKANQLGINLGYSSKEECFDQLGEIGQIKL